MLLPSQVKEILQQAADSKAELISDLTAKIRKQPGMRIVEGPDRFHTIRVSGLYYSGSTRRAMASTYEGTDLSLLELPLEILCDLHLQLK